MRQHVSDLDKPQYCEGQRPGCPNGERAGEFIKVLTREIPEVGAPMSYNWSKWTLG